MTGMTIKLQRFRKGGEVQPLISNVYKPFWSSAETPSAFISPSTIQLLTEIYGEKEDVIACYAIDSGNMIAFGWFRARGMKMQPLSAGNADHNFIQLPYLNKSKKISEAVKGILNKLIIAGYNLSWPNFPTYSVMGDYVKSLSSSNYTAINYSVCPVHRQINGDELLAGITNKKLEYYKRRLGKMGAQFQCYDDLTDLEEWIAAFTENHRIRWKEIKSKYESDDNVHLLRNRIMSWVNDGIAMRFSIRLDGKFIAMCVGIKEGKSRLIYHAITYNQDYHKYSPGKALILFIAETMKDRQMNELDFGEGDEHYKHSFTTHTQPIEILYIYPVSAYLFRLKAEILKRIRENERSYRAAEKIKSGLQSLGLLKK